tara:strand:- start:2110 stop:2289 length:180 start_codon:yes stop_codon:yes gene_type:complete
MTLGERRKVLVKQLEEAVIKDNRLSSEKSANRELISRLQGAIEVVDAIEKEESEDEKSD